MNVKQVKRPTFAGLFRLCGPAFAFGIILVVTIQVAFGEFALYLIPVAIATWVSSVGFLFILTVVLGKLFGPMWDDYERQQGAIAPAEEPSATPPEPLKSASKPVVVSVRLVILIAFGSALIGGTGAALIFGNLMALTMAIGLGSVGALMWVVLWLLNRERFERSGMRW
jgi:hypothetical protein